MDPKCDTGLATFLPQHGCSIETHEGNWIEVTSTSRNANKNIEETSNNKKYAEVAKTDVDNKTNEPSILGPPYC